MQKNMTFGGASDVAAILLVAGVGRRLGGSVNPPKVLLEFGGQTLLERHLKALQAGGVGTVSLTVGHDEGAIRREVDGLGFGGLVRFVTNPRYREGSLVSLWAQCDLLRSGVPVLLMDGDVLYDQAMMTRLLTAKGENILLVDRDIEPGDEPVKICFQGERIVDFRKKPEHAHDWHGESVGFFRFSPAMAAALADRCAIYVERGETGVEYEEAIRDLILGAPERFSAVDVSDLAWTEIDFDVDVARARQSILPQLGG
jgi:choline kinase